MNRYSIKKIFIFYIVLCLPAVYLSAPVPVEFFFRSGCGECAKVRAQGLTQLAETCAGQYHLQERDLEKTEHYLALAAYQEAWDYRGNDPVFVVVNRETLLAGADEINGGLVDTVRNAWNRAPGPPITARTDLLARRAARFTPMAVAVAGLLDGINPCVFAGLVFFMSLLIAARVRNRELLAVGGVYCLGCFLTYLALGFGLFQVLNLLSGVNALKLILNWTMIGLLLVLAVVSWLDAARYFHSGRGDDVKLQLPSRLKERMHQLMKQTLTRPGRLLAGIFLLSVAVTAIESVCTGQLYVPTLILLTKSNGWGTHVLYLLLYNLMFILPLIAVFGLVWRGITTARLIQLSRNSVIGSKILLGAFFVLLAGLLGWLS